MVPDDGALGVGSRDYQRARECRARRHPPRRSDARRRRDRSSASRRGVHQRTRPRVHSERRPARAGVRANPHDRTAFFLLPGGVGTLDEAFEVLALMQLRRIGSTRQVPFLVMNYDGVYDGLLDFLNRDMVEYGGLREGELEPHWHECRSNAEALAYLAAFYAREDDDDG